ncbi:MAG: zinc ribbon domain-containing protein [Bacteroidales bacterium]|nr:zinc ribbon domain-containing protein [Bacteroidales bacterium]
MEENEKKNGVQETLDKVSDQFKNAADNTAECDQADINSNKVMAILAYLGILVLIPLFAAKDSKFARFHTNQGLLLLLVAILCGVISRIPVIGFLGSILGFISGIFAIIGIVYAIQGKAKELPLIGKYRILK